MGKFFKYLGRIMALLIIIVSLPLFAFLIVFKIYPSWQNIYLYDNGFVLTTTIVAAMTAVYGFRRMGQGIRSPYSGLYNWGFMSGVIVPLLVYAGYFAMIRAV